MNRLKVWIYVVLAVSAGALFLRSSSLDAIERSRTAIDHRLRAAGAFAEASLRSRDEKVVAIAGLAARDARLASALAVAAEPLTPPRGKRPSEPAPADEATRESDRLRAVREAAAKAAAALNVDAKTRLEVWVAGEGDFADGAKGDAAVMALLRAAAGGDARTARLVLDGVPFTVAAAPTGQGGAVAVALPLDAAWASAVTTATGADVTVSAPGGKPITTISGPAAKSVEAVTQAGLRSPRAVAQVGALAPVPVELPFWSKGISAPLLLAKAPAQLVLALPLDGLKGAAVVVSADTAAALAPLVREQWLGLNGLAALLLLGLLFGLTVRGATAAAVPNELVAAAARIEKGDFSARAPALPGKLGTVAAALNAAAAAAAKPAPAPEPMFPLPAPAPEAEPSAFDFGSRAPAPDPFAPPAAPEPSPAPLATPATFDAGAPFGAAPAPFAPAAAAPEPTPAPVTATAELLQGAARTAAPAEAAAPEGDDAHWEQVFQEFLRVRRECGEPAEGLAYERFRLKLEKNRDQLVQKYGCRTVKFQVYVKEGKAALKATPVR